MEQKLLNCNGGEFEAASTIAVAARKAFQTLLPMAGFVTEHFCSKTSCHRQRGLSEFIYKISFKPNLRYLKFRCKHDVHNSNSQNAKGIDVLFIIKPQSSHQTMGHQYPWLMINIYHSQSY
jgi:hypothetical protein